MGKLIIDSQDLSKWYICNWLMIEHGSLNCMQCHMYVSIMLCAKCCAFLAQVAEQFTSVEKVPGPG